MKFQVTIDRDEDGVWIAECPAIPGCVSQGANRKEALRNIEEAISFAWRCGLSEGCRSPLKLARSR